MTNVSDVFAQRLERIEIDVVAIKRVVIPSDTNILPSSSNPSSPPPPPPSDDEQTPSDPHMPPPSHTHVTATSAENQHPFL